MTMTLGELIVAVDDECGTALERAAVIIDLLESRRVRSVPPLRVVWRACVECRKYRAAFRSGLCVWCNVSMDPFPGLEDVGEGMPAEELAEEISAGAAPVAAACEHIARPGEALRQKQKQQHV